MGQYSYESYAKANGNSNNNGNYQKKEFPKIGHFWLNQENPTAIVRFDVASGSDLVIADVHRVKVGTSWRQVACLRNDDSEAWANCPLCKNNIKSRSTNVFVRMLVYKIEDGKVVAYPFCWSRYKSFADELMSYLTNYGDLREHLFKVTYSIGQNGKGQYSVMYQPEMGIYTEQAGYVKDFSAFKGFLVNKHSYMERTFEELEHFVATGEMASRKPADKPKDGAGNAVAPATQPVQQTAQQPVATQPVQAPAPAVARATVNAGAQYGNIESVPPVSMAYEGTAPATTSPKAVEPAESDPTTARRVRRYDFDSIDK